MAKLSMKENERRKSETPAETKRRRKEKYELANLRNPLLKAQEIHMIKKDYEAVDHLRMGRIHCNFEYGNEKRLESIIKEVRHRLRIMKKEIYNIGELLVEAKVIVGHGPFQQWIADTFDFSYETANNFMNVYKVCLGNPHIVTTMKASVLYQIASPNFPSDLRECIFEHCDVLFTHWDQNAKRLEDIKNKDIKDLLTRYKAGELDLNSDSVQKYFESHQRYVQHGYVYDQIELCLRALDKHKDNIATVCGKCKIAGYDSNDHKGQDPKVGKKIHEIFNAIDQFSEELTLLMSELGD